MADFKILCPACASILSSKKPIANGKKITCPHCHKPFVAATSEAASSSDSGSIEFEFDNPAAPAAAPAPKQEGSRSKSKPSITPAAPPARSGSRRALVWCSILFLVVAAAGGGAFGMYYFMLPPETSTAHKGKAKAPAEPAADKSDKDKGDAKIAANLAKAKKDQRKDAKGGKGAEPAGGAKLDIEKKDDGDKQAAPAGKANAPMTAVAAAPAKRMKADWKEFKSAKGGFAVDFPARPDEMRERDDDLIFYETKAELNGFTYEITFHRLKKDELAMPLPERFAKIAAEYKEAPLAKKEVEFEAIPKTPVLELTVHRNDKKDVAVERWLLYKEHVFQVSVCGDKEKLGPDQVGRFMQTFRFVADPQGDFLDLTKTTGIPPERKKK